MNEKVTKDYYIKVHYDGDPVPEKAGSVENNIARSVTVAFAEWPNNRIEVEPLEWIDVNEKPPIDGQDVFFIVEDQDPVYNGRVFGGRYLYKRGYGHSFMTPHFHWKVRYYMPIPNIPKPNK